jgi:hypothetical protein
MTIDRNRLTLGRIALAFINADPERRTDFEKFEADEELRDLTTMTDEELREYENGVSIAVDAGENDNGELERVWKEQERRRERDGVIARP